MKILSLAVFAAGCGGDSAKKDSGAKQGSEKVLRVGTNADFAPFEFQNVNGKEYEGFDMDEHTKKYYPQLSAYANALHKSGIDVTHALLYYPVHEVIHELKV